MERSLFDCGQMLAGTHLAGVPVAWGYGMAMLGVFSIALIAWVLNRRRVAHLRELTAIRISELERSRRQAEEGSFAKSEFLATMSHEVRTPMNAIIGLAEILKKSADLPSKQAEYLNVLQKSAYSLLDLLNSMLDLSRIDADGLELEEIPFSLHVLIRDIIAVLRPQAEAKGLSLTFEDYCRWHGYVAGDPLRLRQVIVNLVGNAIKFTELGGVSIRLYGDAEDERQLNLTLEVEDTGAGIAPNMLSEIFKRFTQADGSNTRLHGGTGLGLAVSEGIVRKMGGSLAVHSTPQRGSTFQLKLALPIVPDQATPPVSEGHIPYTASFPTHWTGPEPEHTPRILLVDDTPENLTVAELLLSHLGYGCDKARTGTEALDRAQSRSYDIIFMDVQMGGMDGLETTRRLRRMEAESGRRTSIVALTAHAMSGDRERCLASGMDDYLTKPFTAHALQEVVSRHLPEHA